VQKGNRRYDKSVMSIINAQVDSEMGNLISNLQSLIRQHSISARKQGLTECANLVARIMNKAGINAEVLYLNYDGQTKVGIEDKIAAGTPPIVFGEVKSKANPNGKTILFYSITITMYSLRTQLSYGMKLHLVEKLKGISSLGVERQTIKVN
jgi:hypothetical protein